MPFNIKNNNIKSIHFGWNFNQPIDNLPKLLTHLSFGNNYEGGSYLDYGSWFNQPIDNLPRREKIL